jgi:hypothetical protein
MLTTCALSACGCILTLKLKESPEECEKRSWTVPADYRNRNDAKVAVIQHAFEQGAIEFLRFSGEPPPKGYKVELPPPREPKNAKRKSIDGVENGGESPRKKPKLLSQAEQFLAASVPSKPAQAHASSSTSRSRSKLTSAEGMLLPRPGYVDQKPEPGELPPDLPVLQHEDPRRPAPQTFTQSREYFSRRSEGSSLRYPGEQRRGYPYGTREHGRKYELGGTRYDDPGLYAPDSYYAPPPASHTQPWHARPSAPIYPEDGYGHPYHDIDRGLDYGPSCDYDYDRERCTAPPLLPPHLPPPVPMPMPKSVHGYGDFERETYDDDYTHAHNYAYARRPHARRYSQQQAPLPSSSYLAELAAELPGVNPPSRRAPPPPSPPRIWEPGPHAAKADARRSQTRSRKPPASAAATTKLEVAPAPALGPTSSSSSSSSLSSSSLSSSPTSPSSSMYPHTMTASEPPTTKLTKPPLAPSKDELSGTSVHRYSSLHCISRDLSVFFSFLVIRMARGGLWRNRVL